MKNKALNGSSIDIQPLDAQFLKEIVRLHRTVLGYTLNSQLGDEHLASIYQHMAQNPKGFVRVALVAGKPVGVISGTTDIDGMKAILFRSLNPGRFGQILIRMLKNPFLLAEFYKGSLIGRPVQVQSEPIPAILTTIAIDPEFQGLGIGAKLVFALEDFFRAQRIPFYRLDTLLSNHSARKFYQKLGFQEFETRADSVILLKSLKNA